MSAPDDVFYTEAIYGAATRQPLVKVLIGKTTMTVPTEDARSMGEALITTAFASDADAYLVEYLTETINLPLPKAVAMLQDFRRWRLEREK
ncbi:hypothetical protein SEA_AVOCADO_34 [Mycobacterium phage Avocado]|uniref:Uncharacterized protein n=1 Tax=Mycobacterium phage Avocado TaxID=2024302 RepID=A0A222Z0F7_9CAUD|nr:hypothetical protein KDW73_gp34 [Mycobacterium phage Avocado]ASR77236.1 hypothetical protein SEA_AVOCADO_34 [Mycobacterium phage Avocado]